MNRRANYDSLNKKILIQKIKLSMNAKAAFK